MKKMISIILTILICLISILPSFSLASNEINTDDYTKIYDANESNNGNLMQAGGQILAVAQVIGVSCAVICLLILGIKYIMMSSNAGDKAAIKEKLTPYVIGAVLLFGGSGLMGIIAKFAQNMGKT